MFKFCLSAPCLSPEGDKIVKKKTKRRERDKEREDEELLINRYANLPSPSREKLCQWL